MASDPYFYVPHSDLATSTGEPNMSIRAKIDLMLLMFRKALVPLGFQVNFRDDSLGNRVRFEMRLSVNRDSNYTITRDFGFLMLEDIRDGMLPMVIRHHLFDILQDVTKAFLERDGDPVRPERIQVMEQLPIQTMFSRPRAVAAAIEQEIHLEAIRKAAESIKTTPPPEPNPVRRIVILEE